MSIYYHGSGKLFDRFDLSHALEGDGKVKFGYGVYVTSKYASAAHYAGEGEQTGHYYVYSVEIPEPTADNSLDYRIDAGAVNPDIVRRTEERLGEAIPKEATLLGKEFRKYIANVVTDNRKTVKQMIAKASVEAEKAAAKFFESIGVLLYIWPTNWKNPEKGLNIAVVNDALVTITKIDEVALDNKQQLIEGSQKTIK